MNKVYKLKPSSKVSFRIKVRRWWQCWGLPLLLILLIVAGTVWNVTTLCKPAASEPTPEPTATPETTPCVVIRYATREEQAERDRETVEAIAKTVWGEARGLNTTEQAAVIWCICNRVDSREFPDDPLMVVQQAGQFDGYSESYPVEDNLVALVKDVIARWEMEKTAVGSVGRVLPANYLFFEGDGQHNHYRENWIKDGNTWDWSLSSPYEEAADRNGTPIDGK